VRFRAVLKKFLDEATCHTERPQKLRLLIEFRPASLVEGSIVSSRKKSIYMANESGVHGDLQGILTPKPDEGEKRAEETMSKTLRVNISSLQLLEHAQESLLNVFIVK
jgi:hypothetical protein